MTLPEISLPLQIPYEVPLLLHPVVVHFAIAIPVLVLVLEFFNLYFKRRALNVITSSLLLVLIGIYLGLFLTGKTDGSEAFDLLSDAGQDELREHKLLGTYLVYASMTLIVFKALATFIAHKAATIIYFLVMLLFIGVNMKQGKDGGELVYEYGANVAAANEAKDRADELGEQIEELQAEIAALKEEKAQSIEAKVGKAVEQIKEALTPDSDAVIDLDAKPKSEAAPESAPEMVEPETAPQTETVETGDVEANASI